MNAEFPNTIYMSGDMYDIGLMAAASPDFADKLLSALLAEGESAAPTEQKLQPVRSGFVRGSTQ
jgi:hypothetical protein